MKKILIALLSLLPFITIAQDTPELVNGVLTQKKVVEYNGMSKGQIYAKVLVALSQYAGTNANSKVNLDVSDKEEGVIVYKGDIFTGWYKQNMMAGWSISADYMLIVKVKDCKAQYKLYVPSLTYQWTGDNSAPKVFNVADIYPYYTAETDYKIEKASKQLAPLLPSYVSQFFDGVIDLTLAQEEDF